MIKNHLSLIVKEGNMQNYCCYTAFILAGIDFNIEGRDGPISTNPSLEDWVLVLESK